MSFNDKKHCGLLALTSSASGHINDLESLLLKTTVTTPPEQLNDMWHTYWDGEFIPKGHFNDRAQTWLNMTGYGRGTLSESWYAFWIAACDGDIGTLPSFDLIFPLSWSLQGRVDTVPTFANFTRAAGPSTVEDFEDVIHACLDGEARFWKARRVENVYGGDSSTVDGINVSTPVIDGEWYQISATATEPFSILEVSGAIVQNVIYQEAGRGGYVAAIQANGTEVLTRRNSGTFVDIQIEHIIEGAKYSEYVSVNTGLVSPWHGANVDGVQYFPTDRDGTPLQGMRGCLVEQSATNLYYPDDINDPVLTVLDLAVGTYTCSAKNESRAASTSVGLTPGTATMVPALGLVTGDSPVTFEITVAGTINVSLSSLGVVIGYHDGVPLAQIETGDFATTMIVGVPTRDATRPAETLNVPRPAVLLQPAVNDIIMSMRTFTVSDGANDLSNTGIMHITGLDALNDLRFGNTDANGTYYFRKRINSVNFDANALNLGHESILRNHIGKLSSVDGMEYSVNGNAGTDPDTQDAITLDQGDGLMQLGTNNAGGNHMNAGISLVAILG